MHDSPNQGIAFCTTPAGVTRLTVSSACDKASPDRFPENCRRFLQSARIGHDPADVLGFNRLQRGFAPQSRLRRRLNAIRKILRLDRFAVAQDDPARSITLRIFA